MVGPSRYCWVFISWSQSASQLIISLCRRALWSFASSCSLVIKTDCDYTNTLTYLLTYLILPYLYLSKELVTKTSDILTCASKTDVTPAILSRDFVARLYRAIMSQRATVQLHAATLSQTNMTNCYIFASSWNRLSCKTKAYDQSNTSEKIRYGTILPCQNCVC